MGTRRANTIRRTAIKPTQRFTTSSPLKRLWYFDGRFLDAADLLTEQTYLRSLVAASNRAGGHGLVNGFDVVARSGKLAVSSGLAVNAEGQVILLGEGVELDVDVLIAEASGRAEPAAEPDSKPNERSRSAAGFGLCDGSNGDDWAGVDAASEYWVLSAAPATTHCGEEESFAPPCASSCETRVDRSYVLEGVEFSVRPFVAQAQQVGIERATIASAWFRSERALRRRRMSRRSLDESFWCEGAEAASSRSVDVAIFCRRDRTIQWLDGWTVRRELCETTTQVHWLNAVDMRPWNVFLAQVLQFQCQLTDCIRNDASVASSYKVDALKEVQALANYAHDGPMNEQAHRAVLAVERLVVARRVDAGHGSRLWDCLGPELPPCGWLPIDSRSDACKSARDWFGHGPVLEIRQVSQDHVGEEFQRAQHRDRIRLDRPAEPVDVLVPVDPAGEELGWMFFARRPFSEPLPCKGESDDGAPVDAGYDLLVAKWVEEAPMEELREAGLSDRQARECAAYRAVNSIRSGADLELIPTIGQATREKIEQYVANRFGIESLDALCKEEYGVGLLELLGDASDLGRLRQRRLAGVVMKEKFGTPSTSDRPIGASGSHRRWEWEPDKLESATGADREDDPEAWLLDQIRIASRSDSEVSWGEFASDADSERGLFKVAMLWLADRLKGRETEDWRAYYHKPETRRFKNFLDVSNALAELPIGGLVAATLPAGPILGAVLMVLLKDGVEGLFIDDPERQFPLEPDAS